MIEVTMTWELRPGIDMQAYGAFAKEAVGMALRAPGFVEFRAQRDLLSPQVRATYVWRDMAAWTDWQQQTSQASQCAPTSRHPGALAGAQSPIGCANVGQRAYPGKRSNQGHTQNRTT